VVQRVAQLRGRGCILRFCSFARHLESFQNECRRKRSTHARNSARTRRWAHTGNQVAQLGCAQTPDTHDAEPRDLVGHKQRDIGGFEKRPCHASKNQLAQSGMTVGAGDD
jgi:hypothetical protein